MTIRTIVVDALQVGPEPSGVGRQVQAIGASLAGLPDRFELELRCTRDAAGLLAPSFPPATRVRTPIESSRPRLRRIAVQQVLFPVRDRSDTLVVSLGDQAPVWGAARRLLVVNDVRRLVQPDTSGLAERAFYRLVVPAAARRADRLVTISEFSRGEIRRALGLDACVVAHHPAPACDASPLPQPNGHLLAVGALRPYKDVETIVDALALVAGDRELVVAGPGDPHASGLARRAAERGLAGRVHFVGWVPDADLERLYRESALTVSASRYEGYGLPVAESIARGRPTIASDIPPHREIGGDAVVYFEPGRAAALADAIAQVLSEPARYAEAALARSQALAAEGPSWKEVVLGAASA